MYNKSALGSIWASIWASILFVLFFTIRSSFFFFCWLGSFLIYKPLPCYTSLLLNFALDIYYIINYSPINFIPLPKFLQISSHQSLQLMGGWWGLSVLFTVRMFQTSTFHSSLFSTPLPPSISVPMHLEEKRERKGLTQKPPDHVKGNIGSWWMKKWSDAPTGGGGREAWNRCTCRRGGLSVKLNDRGMVKAPLPGAEHVCTWRKKYLRHTRWSWQQEEW